MLVKFLQGKKTLIVAVLMAVATFAVYMGWLDQKMFETVVGLLASLGLVTLRQGIRDDINKLNPQPEPPKPVAAPKVL